MRVVLRLETAGNLPVVSFLTISLAALRLQAWCWAAPGPSTPTFSAPASIPSVSSAAFEAPPVTSSTIVAARPARPNFNEIFASLPDRSPLISAPENVSASLMFNERFAAASPQGEPPRPVEATRLADAPPVDAPKAAGTPRLAEGPKTKRLSARAERPGAEAGAMPNLPMPSLSMPSPRRSRPDPPSATWRSAPRPP